MQKVKVYTINSDIPNSNNKKVTNTNAGARYSLRIQNKIRYIAIDSTKISVGIEFFSMHNRVPVHRVCCYLCLQYGAFTNFFCYLLCIFVSFLNKYRLPCKICRCHSQRTNKDFQQVFLSKVCTVCRHFVLVRFYVLVPYIVLSLVMNTSNFLIYIDIHLL